MLMAETPIVKPMFDNRNCYCKFTLYGPFGTCFVSEMEDEAMSVYHDDRKILDNTKIIKIIITKLLSLCLTTEMFEDRNC